MLKSHGYMQYSGDAQFQEFDSIVCGHCNKVVKVKPGYGNTVYIIESLRVDPITKKYHIEAKEEAGAMCRCCMRAVCLQCDDVGTCTPLMKQIEAQEARSRMLKSVGL
jgi:hypothetical protein